jgi:hypothetical protein
MLRIATIIALALASPAYAGSQDCPAAVKAAIDKAFPQATISKCKLEREHDRDQYEVKLTKADRSNVEVDVSTDGKILQVEESIAVDKVPSVVMKAFAAKYPKAKVEAAEKQTSSSGAVSYELAFKVDAKRREATFTETGKFVEEE